MAADGQSIHAARMGAASGKRLLAGRIEYKWPLNLPGAQQTDGPSTPCNTPQPADSRWKVHSRRQGKHGIKGVQQWRSIHAMRIGWKQQLVDQDGSSIKPFNTATRRLNQQDKQRMEGPPTPFNESLG